MVVDYIEANIFAIVNEGVLHMPSKKVQELVTFFVFIDVFHFWT